jgi:HAE1 family hydrophobic/amphiphilic exporter-1
MSKGKPLSIILSAVLLSAHGAAFAQNLPPSTSSPSSTAQTPPAGTTTQQPQNQQQQNQNQQQPAAPQPSQPPNAPGSTVSPTNEQQQSTQPQTGPQQQQQQTTPNTQGPLPPQPQPPGQTPNSTTLPGPATPGGATPTGSGATPGNSSVTGANGANATTRTPGQNVGVSTGIAPAELPAEPPPVAPNYTAPQRPLPSADRVGVDVSDQYPLALNDAIRMALKNSNDIDESRVDVQIAEYNLRAARGVYDPLFSSTDYYERATTPTSSTLGGAGASGAVTQTSGVGALRLSGFSPWQGGSYEFDFSSTRLTTTNQNVTLNPQYPTAATFIYTQPLLRNRRFDNNRRQIEIAKKNLSMSDAQFRQKAIDVISQVEQAYWDLVFALRNLQVQIDAVKQARVQVESNRRMVAQGVLAPIDIVAAQTQVTTFEQNVYTAQQSVTQAENTLKTLILPDRGAPLWSRALTPVTPVSLEAPAVPLGDAVTSALEHRLDLAELKTSAELNKIDERYYRDQTRPQLDLVGTYTTDGLAGALVSNPNSSRGTSPVLIQRVNDLSAIAGLPPITITSTTTSPAPNLVGGYTQSLANLFEQRYPTARVGVNLSFPLRNRTAEANLGRTLAQGTRIRDQVKQQEQLIEADVRNSLQAVRSAQAQLAAAAASRSSAEQQYESQLRQFRAGTTTVFLVLQAQTTLLAARGSELQAQTNLNKAISQLQHATGSTLEANNIAVVKDAKDSPARGLEMSIPPGLDSFMPGDSFAPQAPAAAKSVNKP